MVGLVIANHMMMDPFTKKVLWDFWIKSDDQEGVVDEGFSDVEEANNDDEQETAEIFRIETNLTKTYEDYENELNDELEEPWSEDGVKGGFQPERLARVWLVTIINSQLLTYTSKLTEDKRAVKPYNRKLY
ncbi:hypothetical protein Tco_0304646 [Tanacetum coccineum]